MNKIKRTKLVIFDLDGTAADTMDGIVEALNRAMRECGYPTHTRESVLRFVNYNTRRYIEEALPTEARTDTEIERVLAVYGEHYAHTYTLSIPFEGLTELLTRLSETCLLAVHTNKQDGFAKSLVERLYPSVPFLTVAGYRPDRPSKPDPTMAYAIMEMASERLGEPLTPADCVYVGDSDVDFYTAVNAGMHPVSVSWGYRSHEFLEALGDQPVAATMEELGEILLAFGV